MWEGVTSPYLLKPLRALDEVLDRARVRPGGRGRGLWGERGATPPGATAAVLRQQGRLLRPRVVWINHAKPPKPRGGG